MPEHILNRRATAATCTAHVDPLAAQQAQTAQQAVGNASLPCASCGSWLRPNNGVTVSGKLYHVSCDPAGASAAQPASAMPPWGNWPNIAYPAPFAVCGGCGGKIVHGSPEKSTCSCRDHKAGDFGTTVSDQLARQREIGGSAKPDAMRVRTFAEQEAERDRMAEHFRRTGVL